MTTWSTKRIDKEFGKVQVAIHSGDAQAAYQWALELGRTGKASILGSAMAARIIALREGAPLDQVLR